MLRGIRPADGLRFGLCTLAAVIGLAAVTTDPADARSRRGKRITMRASSRTRRRTRTSWSMPSGEDLARGNADALRHPASLTKVMTLYLLFEQLEAGKLRLNSSSRFPPMRRGSRRPSSACGRPTIKVEDAIKALVTRSANRSPW